MVEKWRGDWPKVGNFGFVAKFVKSQGKQKIVWKSKG